MEEFNTREIECLRQVLFAVEYYGIEGWSDRSSEFFAEATLKKVIRHLEPIAATCRCQCDRRGKGDACDRYCSMCGSDLQ